MKDKIYEHTLP